MHSNKQDVSERIHFRPKRAKSGTIRYVPTVPNMETTQTEKPSVRIEWIDILRGLAMFLVCYAHMTVTDGINNYIYSFHMPLFFLISGLTFAFNKETRILPYIWKKIKGLVIPYFVLNVFVAPLYFWNAAVGLWPKQTVGQLALGILLSQKTTGFRMSSNTTWFITCLFLADILFFLFWKFCKKDRYLVIALPVFCILLQVFCPFLIDILSYSVS